MQKTFLAALLFAAVGIAAVAPVASEADNARPAPVGRWLTESGNLEVDIMPCNPQSDGAQAHQAFCGTVARVLANRSMSNPNEAMQASDGRSALGMKLLTDFSPSGSGEWQGRIYNRENGKTYDCRITQTAPDRLQLRAYVFLPLFGKTQVWSRVSRSATK